MQHHSISHLIARIVLSAVAFFDNFNAHAQVDAKLTHYWAVPSYYNPAAIGLTDFINITGGSRLQWIGIPRAPMSFIASGNMPFKLFNKRFGVGVVVSHDSFGLYKNLIASAQISYKIHLFKGSLSIGAQVGIINDSFKGSEIVIPDGDEAHEPSDPGIPTTDVTGTGFDVAAGIHYQHKYFWLGASVTHINNASIALKSDGTENPLYEFKAGRAYYFMAGGNIPIKNSLFDILPSGFFKFDGVTWQAEVTARARFKKFLSAGVGYRWKDAVSILIGAEFKNFFIGYSYDYSISPISKATSGSHEVFLQYNVKLDLREKNKNKHKSIRIM